MRCSTYPVSTNNLSDIGDYVREMKSFLAAYRQGGYVYAKFNAKNPKAKTTLVYCIMDMVPVSPENWAVPPP
jgi:hypothetical protein